jgi:hypothetical protein
MRGFGEACAHCGRTDTVKGSVSTWGCRAFVYLCHGTDPDCHHLVTGGHELGSLRYGTANYQGRRP